MTSFRFKPLAVQRARVKTPFEGILKNHSATRPYRRSFGHRDTAIRTYHDAAFAGCTIFSGWPRFAHQWKYVPWLVTDRPTLSNNYISELQNYAGTGPDRDPELVGTRNSRYVLYSRLTTGGSRSNTWNRYVSVPTPRQKSAAKSSTCKVNPQAQANIQSQNFRPKVSLRAVVLANLQGESFLVLCGIWWCGALLLVRSSVLPGSVCELHVQGVNLSTKSETVCPDRAAAALCGFVGLQNPRIRTKN